MTTAVSVELDASQIAALDAVSAWLAARLADPKQPQVFRVGGHAGSGKTTIIKEVLARFPDLKIAVTTFTGKASEVLRGKGVEQAINLHQIFYMPDPVKLAEKAVLEHDLETAAPENRQPIRDLIQRLNAELFVRVETIPFDLVIVDEATMVPGRITEDLLRFGVPVLAVGDPAQLPPVEANVYLEPLFADQEIDAMLTGSHRHRGGSLLAEVADAARHDRGLPAEVIVTDPDLTEYDAILVFTNDCRWRTIKTVRQQLGKPVDAPIPGDTIMVQRNDQKLMVFNGSTLTIATVERAWEVKHALRITTTDGDQLLIDARGFTEAGLREALRHPAKGAVVASFCEAITVHKAQGSEWPRVLVAQDHSRVGSREDRVRWRYTAVTRAQEAVHVVGASFLRPVI